ncbi:MAG: YCF48-related protein [Bacteroidota bacterium]
MKTNLLITTIIIICSQKTIAQTWTMQNSSTTEKLNSLSINLSYQNNINIWVAGNNNTGIVTQDSGSSWFPSIVTNADNYGVHFNEYAHGTFVGAASSIMNTDVGGLWWYPQSASVTPPYYDVWFSDFYNGWIVGADGTLIHTTQGNLWSAQNSGTTHNLRSLMGVAGNSNEIWAAGDSGVIIHTVNAGTNWNSQTSNTAEDLKSVYFLNPDTGWVCGTNGTILNTMNGGGNWTIQNSGTNQSLNGIWFLNSLNGWAVGSNGVIISTGNGGLNWNPEISGVTVNLSAVEFYNQNNGWAVGDSGTIIKYSPALTSVENLSVSFSAISLFPDPAENILSLKFNSLLPSEFKVAIVGADGKTVLTRRLSKFDAGRKTEFIDIKNLKSGAYTLVLSTGKQTSKAIFIKR